MYKKYTLFFINLHTSKCSSSGHTFMVRKLWVHDEDVDGKWHKIYILHIIIHFTIIYKVIIIYVLPIVIYFTNSLTFFLSFYSDESEVRTGCTELMVISTLWESSVWRLQWDRSCRTECFWNFATCAWRWLPLKPSDHRNSSFCISQDVVRVLLLEQLPGWLGPLRCVELLAPHVPVVDFCLGNCLVWRVLGVCVCASLSLLR